jgi:hypothetical protein
MEEGQQEAPVGRRHYRVRHRRRIGQPRRLEQHRRAAAAPRPRSARQERQERQEPQEPQAVLEWAALRRVQPLALAALVLKWLLIALLCLAVLDVARTAGVPIVLIVLVWAWSAAVRGRRRSGYRAPERAPRDAQQAAPRSVPPAAAAGPPRGSPYDLETYLRRLGEDGS